MKRLKEEIVIGAHFLERAKRFIFKPLFFCNKLFINHLNNISHNKLFNYTYMNIVENRKENYSQNKMILYAY